MLACSAICMNAASPTVDLQMEKATDNLKVTTIKNSTSKNVTRIAKGVTLSTANGIKKLNIANYLTDNNRSIKPLHSHIRKAKAPAESVLFESFEGWDGENINWTPEGWTVDMRGEVERKESWTPYTPNQLSGFINVPDGKYGYAVSYGSARQDEWLISPEVDVAEGYTLTYWLFLDPVYLFNIDNVDWDTLEFTEEPEVAATLQIWAQPAGEEWVMLHDYADDFRGLSFLELSYMTPASMEKKNISLDTFVGKKVKIAFRYVGIDGNTMIIDAISVGYPELDDISYMEPFSTLYWGFDRSAGMTGLLADIAMQPVYEPLTWTNMTYIEGAEYTWTYCDPETAEFVTDSENPDALTVTYVPDYSSEATMVNNFFYPPTLTATAPNSTPGSYTAPYAYFQAGGKAERTLNDGTLFEASLLPFAYNNLGLTFVTCDDKTIGDPVIPVFGYNKHTDQYWLNYSLNGADPAEGDYSRLEGIANLFWASEAPLVVNGITAYGWGHVKPDAEFTAVIYGLNSEMSSDFETMTEIASTTLKGSEFLVQYPDANGYMCMPFDFDEPVVIRKTEEHPAYFIMLKGFNSDKVNYFAPLQSSIDDPNYMCLGYILTDVNMSNHVNGFSRRGLKPMVYKQDGEYVDLYAAFAIGLDAEYPWLTTDVTEVEIPSNGAPVEVKLGSYFDGSKLTVETPAGVEGSVAGRYDKCVLTLRHNDAEIIAEGNVVVKGPGVEVSIPVKEVAAGINDIFTDGNSKEATGIYDLNGRRVNVEEAKAGIYVIKYSDGTAGKTVLK